MLNTLNYYSESSTCAKHIDRSHCVLFCASLPRKITDKSHPKAIVTTLKISKDPSGDPFRSLLRKGQKTCKNRTQKLVDSGPRVSKHYMIHVIIFHLRIYKSLIHVVVGSGYCNQWGRNQDQHCPTNLEINKLNSLKQSWGLIFEWFLVIAQCLCLSFICSYLFVSCRCSCCRALF